jgi:hypothetical protein
MQRRKIQIEVREEVRMVAVVSEAHMNMNGLSYLRKEWVREKPEVVLPRVSNRS